MNPFKLEVDLPTDSFVTLTWPIVFLAFLGLLAFWYDLVEKRPRAARMRAIARRRQKADQGRRHPKFPPSSRRRESLLARVARQLLMLQISQVAKITARLELAGFRTREAVAVYLIVKLLGPAAAGMGGLAIAYLSGIFLSNFSKFLFVGGLIGVSLLGPELFLTNAAARRRQKLQQALPDTLDLLVICAEAGLTLDAALHRVANELAASVPEMADELAVTSVELSFLPERRLALQNLARRINLPAIRGVVSTLIQTERYGTPLAHSLRILSAEFREQRMLRAEEKAGRLPAILTVPMIVFILPTLFVVLIGPALIDVLSHNIR